MKIFDIKTVWLLFQIVFFYFTFSYSVLAQVVVELSLSEVQEKALIHNYSLQAEALFSKAKYKLIKSATILPKTELSISLGQMNTIRFDENISISQKITHPIHQKAKRQLAKDQATLASLKTDLSKKKIQLEIAKNWHHLLYLREIRQVLFKEDSLLSEFLKVTTFRFDRGDIGVLEKMTAENKQQQSSQALREVENLITIQKMEIKQLAGFTEDFRPADSVFTKMNFTLPNSWDALKNNLVMQYAQAEVKAVKAEEYLAKKEVLADFQIGYSIQSLAGPMEINNQNKNFNALPQFQTLTLGAAVPIFGQAAYKAKSESVGLRVQALKMEQSALEKQLESRSDQLLERYNFYQQHLNYFEKIALPNSKRLIQYAKISYKNGESDYIAYLQALEIDLNNKKNYWRTLLELNQTILELQNLLLST